MLESYYPLYVVWLMGASPFPLPGLPSDGHQAQAGLVTSTTLLVYANGSLWGCHWLST